MIPLACWLMCLWRLMCHYFTVEDVKLCLMRLGVGGRCGIKIQRSWPLLRPVLDSTQLWSPIYLASCCPFSKMVSNHWVVKEAAGFASQIVNHASLSLLLPLLLTSLSGVSPFLGNPLRKYNGKIDRGLSEWAIMSLCYRFYYPDPQGHSSKWLLQQNVSGYIK